MEIPKAKKVRETIFQTVNNWEFPQIMWDTKPQVQEAHRTPKIINAKKNKLYLGILFTKYHSAFFQARFTDINFKQPQARKNVYVTHSLKETCTDTMTIRNDCLGRTVPSPMDKHRIHL